ncbi:MAG TPA: FAD-binding oxidoreductase [Candidatus Eisenbacteria bacterium]
MSDVSVLDVNGIKTTLDSAALDALRGAMRGAVLRPGDAGYEEARRIWNAMIDRRPALIARCEGTADVLAAVSFARRHKLRIAVRGGGHNIAGNAVCDDGLVIDLSPMRSVRVDPVAKRAVAGGGTLLGDFDHETQAFGLAAPVGINSTTGLAGLTLGGGFGWLSRRFGLAVDNLIAADVVTADGKLLRASAKENPDLFWGLRGGGGNLGIVTSFEFKLHPVGPEVTAGLIVFPLQQGKKVLEKYRAFALKMPKDLNVWVVMRKAPPLPFLPSHVHGTNVVVLALCATGEGAKADRAVARLRRFGKPVGEHVGRMPFVAWQKAFDPLLTPGARNYWKSHNFTELNDEVLGHLIDFAGRVPSPHCEVFVGALGGQVNKVAADATAYPHRDAEFVMNVHGRWETAAEDDRCIGWARELFRATAPSASGVYVNFMTQEETDRVRAAYGPNYDRLAKIKAKYDPKNVLCMNQNVKPAS